MIRDKVLPLLLALLASPLWLHAQAGVAPQILLDPASATAGKQVVATNGSDSQVTTSLGKDGLTVHIQAGDAAYPGLSIKPSNGTPWNLGMYGHVEAKVTNTGTTRLKLNIRVDNEGASSTQPWNAEAKTIDPGQAKTLRVYFGYSYGFRPGFKLKPEAVTQVLFFTGKTSEALSFRIERIQGAGWVGEKIGVDPDRAAVKPLNGILLDAATMIQPASQIASKDGAKGSLGSGGKFLQLDFTGGKEQSIPLRPAMGLWNLIEHLEVNV